MVQGKLKLSFFFGGEESSQLEPSGQEFCMEASIGSNRHALANGDQKTQPVRLGCQVLLAVGFYHND